MSRSPCVRLAALCSLTLALLAVAGCSGKKAVKVKGKVVGANLKVGAGETLSVNFHASGDTPTAYPASITPEDNSFTVAGGEGKGFPPGKYKISVQLQSYGDQSKVKPETKKLNEKYNSEKTPLTYEVTEDAEQNIVVDIEKGTVTKQ